MLNFIPKQISGRGVVVYIISLLAVSIAFASYSIDMFWMFMGLVEILMFFIFSNILTVRWQNLSVKSFTKYLFIAALLIRLAWVIFSYFFYQYKTGIPFEFDAADSLGYHGEAEELAGLPWDWVWYSLFESRNKVSDSGYVLYLTVLYKIFGPNIVIVRLLKAFYGAVSCLLLYKLTSRIANENVGRMAGIFAMLMPNLIIYCGLHLKETEMLFLLVAFLERADYVLRVRKFTLWNIIFPLLLAGSLFLFRTVLGAVALLSFITAIVFSPNKFIKRGRKVAFAFWIVLAIAVMAGGTIRNEVEGLWEDKDSNQDSRRLEQTLRGNQWAKYATATVMAPMEFVIPFSTMVDTGQENQLVMHAGNYVRNFMGMFVLITIFTAVFVKRNWRELSLVGSFVIGYLSVIALSGFASSERFLLPGLPGLIILWANGVSELSVKNYKFVRFWCLLVVVMEVGWAYFKIGSRGLL